MIARSHTAEVGRANAAWLADPVNFAGEVVALDHGDGTVTVTAEQLATLRGFDPTGGPGDLCADDEHGLFLRLPHEYPAGSGFTEFWLTDPVARLV